MKNITQKELADYRRLENKIKDLGELFADTKADIITRLDKGAVVSKGERTASMIKVPRRSPNWKNVVIRLKGEGYAKRVLAAFKPTFYFKLTVR